MARRPGIDLFRGAALWAMAAYHLTWDLAHFGWIDSDVAGAMAFHWIGHSIAASFLGLAGFSLVLARHAQGALWRSPRFWRRWATIVAAAGAISATSYWLLPATPIFFGILHCIALAILLALPLVEAPWAATLAAALAALAAPYFFTGPLFNAPALWWTGLSTLTPDSNDFRPLLPWLGFVLLGLALGQRATLRPQLASANDDDNLAYAPASHPNPLPARGERGLSHALAFCGRHSLAFYLVHQPLLFGFFSLVGLFVAPAPDESLFLGQCAVQCVKSGAEADLCEKSCSCVVADAKARGLWTSLAQDRLTQQEKSLVHDAAVACYAQAVGK